MASTVFSILSLLSIFPFVVGYSFDITAAPTQCGPLSLQITGGSGSPPYTALVIPFGPPPGATEQRIVFAHQFSDSTANFSLPYPANSNFVVMMSDSSGVGTGGTSVPTTVGSSNNSSCLTTSPSPGFSFQILPDNAVNQCQPTTLAWDNNAQGNVTILLVIPGGESSKIDTSIATSLPGSVTGFQWSPNVRTGTTVLLVAGDSRGPGTGGSVNTAIGNSPTSNTTCLNSQSPSSTAGTPAGAVQTSASSNSGSNNGNNGGSSGGSTSNAGAIAGGIVGGLVAAIIGVLVALFFIRKRRRQRHPVAHGVDLLPDGGGGGGGIGGGRDPEQPPEFYQPEPFIVPPSLYSQSRADAEESVAGGSRLGRPSMSDLGGQRYSALSTTDQSESAYETSRGGMSANLLASGSGGGGTTGQSTSYGPGSARKSPGGMPQLRPVNFVLHEDAGGLPEAGGSGQTDENENETIELPPSYNSVRR